MPEFQELQQKLVEARRAQVQAQQGLLRSADQISQLDTQLRDLQRSAVDGDRGAAARRRALEERRQALKDKRREQENELVRTRATLDGFHGVFWDDFSDPRQHAARMDDAIPVLLFPLRLETRFKSVTGPEGAQRPQLWVRVFPDDCLVDTFDETLAKNELDSADIFWREFFRAAGVEADQRAAWRGLVASLGSGRAAWVMQHYRPLNPLAPGDPLGNAALEVKPQSRAAGDVILVTSVDGTLTAAERTALGDFWTATWKADGKFALEEAANAALVAAVGAARAAELVKDAAPYNLREAPPATFTRQTANVRFAVVFLTPRDDIDARTRSWMKPARAELLPERLVLLGFRGNQEILNQIGAPVQGPFDVSPDPTATSGEQFQFDAQGNLQLGANLHWMTDFDEAVRRGMGFRVDLTPQQAAGFDRLFVLGLRLGSSPEQGKTELESLFQHHYFSSSGFSLLPQGAPTNNTEEQNSAQSRGDDPDASYDFVFNGKAQFTETDEVLDKSDGQWLAESLGLDTEWLKQIPHAGGTDQSEARAMNTVLWPATLGYFMDTLLQPVFDDDAVYHTRWFFNRYVSGRGMVPAIRVGRQPYGILPTTAFGKIRWTEGEQRVPLAGHTRFLEKRSSGFDQWLVKYKKVLDGLHATWIDKARGVSRVDPDAADPHAALLDIVGLHPASVEFHQRYAQTKGQEHNIALLFQEFLSWQTLPANEQHNQAYDVLTSLGYTDPQVPKLFDLFWKVFPNRLNGPVIQDGPMSETEPLRNVTTNNHNYIEWLHEWAKVSFDTIRVQDGFQANQWPNALLYVLMRHALELGYHDAGVRLLDEAGLLDTPARMALRTEPHFFHVAETSVKGVSDKSRYEILYSPAQAVTGDAHKPLATHITDMLGTAFGTRYLAEQLRAIGKLERTPTARLERAFAEHLDCCTYRFDAWAGGLINFQLASMRATRRKGTHLGAYGWLEDVKPEPRTLTPVRLEGELDEIFNRQQPGTPAPLLSDDTNEGFIHAPSVNHAVTAAVLRNGYLAHATPATPDLMKVNLSSERVRLALGFIEGIRNGQSLGALLGYQFERGLHDRYALAESDQFIYPLRRVFPLYTGKKNLPPGVSIEAIEARNVLDGLALVRFVRGAPDANKKYPFGQPPSVLPPAGLAQASLDAEVDRLLDIHDALADLALAEGVHQVVQGNYDRAAATMDAYSQATFPPIPDVVQTPRSGIVLTHRVGLQFDSNAVAVAGDNPRSRAEPAMARWVAGLLPDAAKVGCSVQYTDAATGTVKHAPVTWADLGLQPLDLVYVMNPDSLQPRAELDDRIREVVLRDAALAVRPDLLGNVDYGARGGVDFSFDEIASVVRSLRALLLRSRPLRATDVALPTEAKGGAGAPVLARARADFLVAELGSLKNGALKTLLDTLDAVFPAAGPDTATIVANIDSYLDAATSVCQDIARYGIPQTGLAALREQGAGIFLELLALAREIETRWQESLDRFDARVLELPALPDDDARIASLLEIERLVSTASTDPTGKTAAQLLTAVQAKAALMRTRQQGFANLKKNTQTTITAFFGAFQALLPITAFDSKPTDDSQVQARIVNFAADVQSRMRQLSVDLDQRATALNDKLTEHDGAASPEKKVEALTEAARSVLGAEFVLVPAFSVPEKQGQEWANAYDDRAKLLDFQKTDKLNPEPVDDWLYGVSRVRPKLHHVENLLFLTEALSTAVPELRPVQLPYSPTAAWMALEYPPAQQANLERELLLYSTIYSQDFDRSQPQCGLLLDEWTEVIPGETETTGLAFHYDKPSSEPPQAMLLATPTQFTGAWSWQDLVDTLHDTLDRARLRAVEPQQLDQTPLSVFLPATILATTWSPITIAADLSVVNNFAARMK